MRPLSAYRTVGFVLMAAGALAAPIFFFVAVSIPLTALALSAVLLGVISFLLARSLPEVPPQAARLLLDTGLSNLAGLLEEIGLDAKAVYLPSRIAGKPKALIPLHVNADRPAITRTLADRMIVDFGPNPEDVGLLVSTPGTTVLPLLDSPLGQSSAELEATLAHVLTGMLDLAASVQVTRDHNDVTVRVNGLRLEDGALAVYRTVGTPVASIAAAVTAEGLASPVMIRSEERTGDRLLVHLEVLA